MLTCTLPIRPLACSAQWGETSLIMAAARGRAPVMATLIKAKAALDVVSKVIRLRS